MRIVIKSTNIPAVVVITIVVVVYCAINQVNAVMRPSNALSLMAGEGFVAYLEVPKSFGTIQNCWYKFRDDEKVRLDLNLTEPITTARGELMLPFAANICGMRVNKLSAASGARWMLETENIFGDFEQDYININILPAAKTHFDTHVQQEIGKGTISCTKHDSYTKHCKIIDAQGQTAAQQCQLYTDIHPNSTFDCLSFNWGRMQESLEHIIVEIKNTTLYTVASVEENDTNSVLRCQFKDTVHSCQAEMPNHHDELYIADGLYNGRYSTYDTIVSKSKCALELPKPFIDADTGLWRIMTYDSSAQATAGCLFYMGKDKKDIIEQELTATLAQNKRIQVYEPESSSNGDTTISEIYCMVPFIIYDCYLRDPNNTVYFPENIKFQRYRLFGKCSFSNVPILAGIWTCGARGHDYDKEVLQNIEVIVKPKRGELLTERLKAKQGDAVELMCKSAFEEPISHCVFIDPLNNVHLVGTAHSIKTAGHVQYYGRGIQLGDCGIKISEVNADDFGQWKCQFVRYAQKPDSTFSMELLESEIAHATSVGLGVGVTVIIVLVAGVVIGTVFYRKRNMHAQHSFPLEDPLQVITPAPSTSPSTQALESS